MIIRNREGGDMENLFLRFPGGKKKALTLSYDDGKEQDIRLVSIMRRNGLKGTFNLNGGGLFEESRKDRRRTLTIREAKELYPENGMEVAVHSLTHPRLELLPVDRCLCEVAEDRKRLEELFGTIVRGMAYPFGTYNEKVIECVKCSGIVYARTTVATEDFRLPEDWFRLETTCHHDNPRLMELAHKFAEETPTLQPWLFYLWGHSYEFAEKDNWKVIEDFSSYMGKRDDIWYATNLEIYEYVEAYGRLVLSMKGDRIYNPSSCRVYFEKDGNVMYVDPMGEITL